MVSPLLFVALPAAGVAAAALLTYRAYSDEVEAVRGECSEEKLIRSRALVMNYLTLPVTVVLFGLVGFMMFYRHDPPLSESVASAVGLNIGLAGLFTSLGEGLVGRAAARDCVKRPENFGRNIIFVMLCEPAVLFALIVMFLTLGNTSAPTDKLVTANYIMAALSFGGLVSGFLGAPGVGLEPRLIGKRIALASLGTTISLPGLLAAFLLMVWVFSSAPAIIAPKSPLRPPEPHAPRACPSARLHINVFIS